MINDYFKKLEMDLKNAAHNDHSFHHAFLSTVDGQLKPRTRTVVIREVSNELGITLFSDLRTTKIHHSRSNPQASLLFYDRDRSKQIILNGSLTFIKDKATVQRHFATVTSRSIKNYTTLLPPGSTIDAPNEVEYLKSDQDYFAPLLLVPTSIEALHLTSPNHLRALYRLENNRWKGEWLVP